MELLSQLQGFRWSKVRRGYSAVSEDAPSSRLSLDRNSEDGLLEKGRGTKQARQLHASIWREPRFLLAHLAIFIIYLFLLLLVCNDRNGGLGVRQEKLYSPAVEAVQWELQHFDLEDRIQDKSPFSGKPTAELDKAWHDLLNAENIIIEPEYMKRLGRENSGVAAPDGSGFIGTLNVYHEIHCLKRIHQYMYPEYYFPGLSERDKEMNRLHNEHCIDFLRQSAMCHGDVGLITFEWQDYSRMPVANSTVHQCVNWDKLDRWTKARTVDMMKPGWLVHPTKGVVYPEGKGDKIGAVDEMR